MERPLRDRSRSRTFVIEVVDMDSRRWTACATETAGILKELRDAPVAVTITIYEWVLAKAINPQGDMFSRFPTWKFIGKSPWVMGREMDGD